MKVILLALASLLLVVGSASAQTGAIVSGTVSYQQAGIPVLNSAQSFLINASLCGQPLFPLPPGTPLIDTTARVVWSDPAAPTTANCVFPLLPGGSIFALAFGTNYTATLTVTDDRGATSAPSAASNTFTRGVTPPPAPVVTSFAPVTGFVGNAVTLTGTNFTGTTAVRFNGIQAGFVVINATTITTNVPLTATTGPITVTGPNGVGTSASNFTVTAPPPPAGPTSVQIRN